MEEKELLRSIGEIMDQKMEPVRQDISGLKAGQDSLQEQFVQINSTLDDMSRKLSALIDAYRLDSEKIDRILETVEAMNNAYAATDMITRMNTAEIDKLKAKIGLGK